MEHIRPADIERRSMEIITSELNARGITLPAENAPIIKRVIHTTADFDYVEQLFFTPNAVQKGIAALLRGETIVTDTNMALSGVSKPGLKKLGGQAVCFMADPEVAAEAKRRGTTRAVVSAETASRAYPGCIYAVGNAPTALFEIVRRMDEGFRPSLVIGVPVGFVNVVEAQGDPAERLSGAGHSGDDRHGTKGRQHRGGGNPQCADLSGGKDAGAGTAGLVRI